MIAGVFGFVLLVLIAAIFTYNDNERKRDHTARMKELELRYTERNNEIQLARLEGKVAAYELGIYHRATPNNAITGH